MDHLLEGRWRDHSKFCQICGKESRGTTGLMQITLCNPKPCCWNSCINKKKQKKSPSCREMKTVMFYSVYLNVPWIAVLSCVEFNLRGDIFLFKPPPPQKKTKNKNQQPKLPKISTSQTESGRSWLTGTTMPARVFRNTKLYQWKRMQLYPQTDLLPPLVSQCQEWQKAITPAWAKCFTSLETFSFRCFPHFWPVVLTAAPQEYPQLLR